MGGIPAWRRQAEHDRGGGVMSMLEIQLEAHDADLPRRQMAGQFEDQALGCEQQRFGFLYGSGQFERNRKAARRGKGQAWVRQQPERTIDFVEKALPEATREAIA